MDCTIYVAKTKVLISFAVTAKLICVFVFAYAKSRFSHDAAHIFLCKYLCIQLLEAIIKQTGSHLQTRKSMFYSLNLHAV